MTTTHVKAHKRAKPSKPQVYIDLHARLRAENEERMRRGMQKILEEQRDVPRIKPSERRWPFWVWRW